MFKVGLTGGIGSGKSTVAKIFEMLGIAVYYADQKAKDLMLKGYVKESVIAEFGTQSYTADGKLNTAYIAGIVFNDKQKLLALNSIVHPALGRDFMEWTASQNSVYVVEEAAVLIESKGYRVMDKIIVTDAPIDLRINRVMNRDGASRESVEARIAAQITDAERIKYADYIVKTDDENLLLPQIVRIDEEIKKIIVSLSSKK